MIVLLSIFLAIQGIPLNERDGGAVSGVLRSTEGKPAAGVRVSALALSEKAEIALGSALASISETDENGRYRLEGVPPGQYYIVAGRVDKPTFYPGASNMTDGAVVRVTRGSALSDMDFVLSDNSVRNPLTEMFGIAGTYLLEIKIAGHAEIAREVVLGIEDVNLELTSEKEISK